MGENDVLFSFPSAAKCSFGRRAELDSISRLWVVPCFASNILTKVVIILFPYLALLFPAFCPFQQPFQQPFHRSRCLHTEVVEKIEVWGESCRTY